MASTSHALTVTPILADQQSGRDRRVTVFRVAAVIVSLGLLVGAMTILFLLAPWVLVGPSMGDDYVAELHRWHHSDVGALLSILVAGSLLALIPAPRLRPALAQAVLVGLGSMISMSLLDELSFGLVAPSVVLSVIVVAVYPAPRSLISWDREGGVSRPILAMALAASIPLAFNVWDNLHLVATDHSQHATEHHWSGSSAVGIALVLTGFLVAARRPGWRHLGVILGLTYLYLGAAALSVPDHGGSWGIDGGLLAIGAGLGFMAAVWAEGRADRFAAE